MKIKIKYARKPSIAFAGKYFCLAGKFDGHGRPDLERQLASRGGSFTANVSETTDYLVIGSQGIRCCTFACCTRVVEKAVALKKNGATLRLIREADFMAALGDDADA